jgi:hypothetical protein
VIVDTICHLSDQEQVEIIADSFSNVSNQYEPIDPAKISINQENNQPTPRLEPHQVYELNILSESKQTLAL